MIDRCYVGEGKVRTLLLRPLRILAVLGAVACFDDYQPEVSCDDPTPEPSRLAFLSVTPDTVDVSWADRQVSVRFAYEPPFVRTEYSATIAVSPTGVDTVRGSSVMTVPGGSEPGTWTVVSHSVGYVTQHCGYDLGGSLITRGGGEVTWSGADLQGDSIESQFEVLNVHW